MIVLLIQEVEQQSYDFFTSSIAGHDEEDVKEEVQEHQRPEGPQEPAEVDNEDQQQEVEEVDRDAPQVSPEQSVQVGANIMPHMVFSTLV